MMKTNRKSKRTLESCKGTLKTDLKTKPSSMDRGIFPNVCSSHVNPFMPRERRGTPQDAEKVLSPDEPWGPAAGSGDRPQPLVTWELRDRSQLGTKCFLGADGGAGGGSGPALGAGRSRAEAMPEPLPTSLLS